MTNNKTADDIAAVLKILKQAHDNAAMIDVIGHSQPYYDAIVAFNRLTAALSGTGDESVTYGVTVDVDGNMVTENYE